MDSGAGPLMKQARELGIQAVFAFGDGACTEKMKELAGDAAEGLICSQAGIPVKAASKTFLEAYKTKFNSDPLIYAPFTYDAANLLIAAMQKADSVDPAKYLPELAKIELPGRDRQDRVRRQGRSQGCGDDHLHDEGAARSSRLPSSRAVNRSRSMIS